MKNRSLMLSGLLALLVGVQTVAAKEPQVDTELRSYKAADTSQQIVSDYIVAIVNNEPITYQELRARLYRVELQLLQAGAALPEREELKGQLLEKMVNDRAQVQTAREMGLRIDDSAVQQALQNMAAQNNMSDVQLLEKLRKDGVSIAQLRSDLRDELLLDKIQDYETNQIKISESELDDYMEQEHQRVQDPRAERINLAQVLVAVPENASAQKIEELRKRAQDIAKRARKEDFANLVKLSDAQKSNGGAMGLRSQADYPDLFADAAATMRVGQVSEPVRSDAGFHILKLLQRSKPQIENSVVQTHARHIIIRPDERMSQGQVIAELKKVKDAITAGKLSFETAAKEYSQDGSAASGGSLGWTAPGQFVPEFEEAMDSLPIGVVSEPIVSRYGVHLIEVQERKRVQVGDLEQRELARKTLRQRKSREALKHWSEDVRARAFVSFPPPPGK